MLKNNSQILKYTDGSKYEGEWKNDEKNGEGVIYL